MLIANPIYDVVFKHLMEDIGLASGIVSRLLRLNVIELTPYPQEISTQVRLQTPATGQLLPAPAPPMVRVYRVDFAALVEMEDGTRRKVLIELQKSQTTDEIERFRSYLGLHYSRHDVRTGIGNGGGGGPDIRPIVPIYILGFLLNRRLPKIIHVTRDYTDGATGERVAAESGKDDFIEKLSHDLTVVQLGKDEELGDTDLGRLLALFDQSKVADASRHYIMVEPDGGLVNDEFIMRLIRKLGQIATDPDTQAQMAVEDELTASFARKNQEIAEAQAQTAEAQAETAKAQAREAEERRQKEEERRQKEGALQELEALRARLREMEK
jgi:hypothetical protein